VTDVPAAAPVTAMVAAPAAASTVAPATAVIRFESLRMTCSSLSLARCVRWNLIRLDMCDLLIVVLTLLLLTWLLLTWDEVASGHCCCPHVTVTERVRIELPEQFAFDAI
jgi:hypothetical protein